MKMKRRCKWALSHAYGKKKNCIVEFVAATLFSSHHCSSQLLAKPPSSTLAVHGGKWKLAKPKG
ncbi:DNA cross-link repair 1A protein [Sesbania bispinosa]|nr:DNA cross-link repair 1A protein [Sesbania bispinosa]